jgi:hypothetical protein
MLTRVLTAFVLLVLGCGARSGLEVPPEPPPEVPDSGLVTFPCRWSSLAVEFELARSDVPLFDVVGFVHPERDELVASASNGSERIGAMLNLALPVRRTREITLRESATGIAAGGRSYVTGDALCRVEWHDSNFETVASRVLEPSPATCLPSPSSVPGALDVFRVEPDALARVFRVRADERSREPLVLLHGSLTALQEGRIIESTGGLYLVGRNVVGPPQLVVQHEPPGGPLGMSMLLGEEVPDLFGLAPDLLLGGAIALHAGARGGSIERLSVAPLRVTTIQDLAGLPANVSTANLAWSETEVLFLLEDGTLAFMPFSGNEIRREPGVVRSDALEAAIALRAGGTLGGIVEVHPDGAEFVLSYWPLACSR